MTATVFAPDSAQPLAEIEATAARVAAVLADLGIRPGDRVLLKADNSAGWVTVFLGLAHAGASIVLVDHQDKAAETDRIQRLTRAVLTVVDDDSVPPAAGETGVRVPVAGRRRVPVGAAAGRAAGPHRLARPARRSDHVVVGFDR